MDLQERYWQLERAFWQLKGAVDAGSNVTTKRIANEIANELNQPARLENWSEATVSQRALQSPPGK